MVKKHQHTEICNAISEIRKNLVSGAITTGLLKERLEQEEHRLLNELYEAVRKKTSTPRQTKTGSKPSKSIPQHPNQGGTNNNG